MQCSLSLFAKVHTETEMATAIPGCLIALASSPIIIIMIIMIIIATTMVNGYSYTTTGQDSAVQCLTKVGV